MVLFGGLWRRIPPIEPSRRVFKRGDDGKLRADRQDRAHSIYSSIRSNDNEAARESQRTLISYQRDSNKDGDSDRGERSQFSYLYDSSRTRKECDTSNIKIDVSERDELPQGATLWTASRGSLPADEQEIPSLTSEFAPSEADVEVLKLCLFYTSIYMGVSVIAFSFVFEKWTIIDSLYFAVSTFTTCGYGNLTPTTPAGQVFTIFFAIYGVIILGVFVGVIGHSISEAHTRALRKLKKGRQIEILETLFTEDERDRKECDELIREGLLYDHATLMDDIKRVLMAELPAILLVAAAALVLGYREQWPVISTMYFCVMSATTTGFGDYTPTTQIDKVYCIFFLPLAVAVFGEILGRIAGVYIQRKVHRAEVKFLHRSITRCDLSRMDVNKDGMVDMEEFLTFMLVALQKVDRESIDDLKTIFRSLDKNGNGMLDKDDLIELAERLDVEELVELAEQNPLLEDDEEHRSEIEAGALAANGGSV